MKIDPNAPAYPALHELDGREGHPHVGYSKFRATNSGGLTIRAVIAMHAPSTPWEWYEPKIPPVPTPPDWEPTNNDGEKVSDPEVRRNLQAWREDPHWEIDDAPEYKRFTGWCQSWRMYWTDRDRWQQIKRRERDLQWPLFHADALLIELNKDTPSDA